MEVVELSEFREFENRDQLQHKVWTCLVEHVQKLKALEIVILVSEKSSLDLIPIQDKLFRRFKDQELEEYGLERLL